MVIKAKLVRWSWLLRYWTLDKYRAEVFVTAAVIALVATAGLAGELWRA